MIDLRFTRLDGSLAHLGHAQAAGRVPMQTWGPSEMARARQEQAHNGNENRKVLQVLALQVNGACYAQPMRLVLIARTWKKDTVEHGLQPGESSVPGMRSAAKAASECHTEMQPRNYLRDPDRGGKPGKTGRALHRSRSCTLSHALVAGDDATTPFPSPLCLLHTY